MYNELVMFLMFYNKMNENYFQDFFIKILGFSNTCYKSLAMPISSSNTFYLDNIMHCIQNVNI